MLKTGCFLLFLLCFLQSVAQEARLYRENDKWGLLGAEKKRLTPAIYDQIIPGTPYSVVKKYEATSARYAVGCIDESGELVIPLVYTDLKIEGLRIIACMKGSQGFTYGVISLKNEVLIPLHYKSVKALGTLRFAVENQEGKFALFTEAGKALTDFTIDSLFPYEKGYSIFEQQGLVGLLDREGNVKVDARYREITLQADGSIRAQKPTQWQWVDNQQQVLKSIEADSLFFSPNQPLIVKNRKGFALLKSDLSTLSDYYTTLTASKQAGLYIVNNRHYGVLNSGGVLLLPPHYDAVQVGDRFLYAKTEKTWKVFSLQGKLLNTRSYEAFEETPDFVHVKKNGFWGALTETGRETIACVYDTILQSKEEQVAVGFKGKYGIINTKEAWLVPPQAYPLRLVSDTHYLQVNGNLLTLKDFSNHTLYFTNHALRQVSDGFIETTSSGELWHVTFTGIVTKLQQKPLQHVSVIEDAYEGYRAIQKDGKWGFVDAQGRLRIANRYDAVRHFSEGLAPFSLRKKWGFINKEDEIIIHPAYDEASPFHTGFSIIKLKGFYGLLTKSNEIILPCRYESIVQLPSGLFELKNKNLLGLANANGMLIYEPKYTHQEFVPDYILVERHGKYGVLDRQGFDIIPTMYDYIRATNNHEFLLVRKGSSELLKP